MAKLRVPKRSPGPPIGTRQARAIAVHANLAAHDRRELFGRLHPRVGNLADLQNSHRTRIHRAIDGADVAQQRKGCIGNPLQHRIEILRHQITTHVRKKSGVLRNRFVPVACCSLCMTRIAPPSIRYMPDCASLGQSLNATTRASLWCLRRPTTRNHHRQITSVNFRVVDAISNRQTPICGCKSRSTGSASPGNCRRGERRDGDELKAGENESDGRSRLVRACWLVELYGGDRFRSRGCRISLRTCLRRSGQRAQVTIVVRQDATRAPGGVS